MSEHAIGDDAALAAVRSAALRLADGCDWSRCADHDVIGAVSAARASGHLDAGQAAPMPALLPLVPRPAAAPASPVPASSALREAAVVPPALPEATFDADLDVTGMVSALQQAARDGVPFCEECARAAAAREASGTSA